jgi:hypothetical protein
MDLLLLVLGGILLASTSGDTSSNTQNNQALPAGGGPSVLSGDQYPVGSVFYNPSTGAPAAFVISEPQLPGGAMEVSISEWNRYNPSVALPPYKIS